MLTLLKRILRKKYVVVPRKVYIDLCGNLGDCYNALYDIAEELDDKNVKVPALVPTHLMITQQHLEHVLDKLLTWSRT